MTTAPLLAMNIGNQITAELGSAKAIEFIEFAANRWPGFQSFTIGDDPNPNLRRINFEHRSWSVPKSMFWNHLHRMALDYHRFILEKYSLPDFCIVDEGDIVLDCGSFIGGFASAAVSVRKAARVIAVEPSPINSTAARTNLAEYPNVMLIQCGLWSECTTRPFNISETAIDDGFLDPDDGSTIKSVEVETLTVSALTKRLNIDRFDFMKIEAEGVELEILKGDGGLNCNKVAVDVAPERNGESPAEEVIELLRAHGFETRQKRIVVFGRKQRDTT